MSRLTDTIRVIGQKKNPHWNEDGQYQTNLKITVWAGI